MNGENRKSICILVRNEYYGGDLCSVNSEGVVKNGCINPKKWVKIPKSGKTGNWL